MLFFFFSFSHCLFPFCSYTSSKSNTSCTKFIHPYIFFFTSSCLLLLSFGIASFESKRKPNNHTPTAAVHKKSHTKSTSNRPHLLPLQFQKLHQLHLQNFIRPAHKLTKLYSLFIERKHREETHSHHDHHRHHHNSHNLVDCTIALPCHPPTTTTIANIHRRVGKNGSFSASSEI